MRVEIVDAAEAERASAVFPPDEDFVDLRENPAAIQKVPAAREYPPLRNFLTTVNGTESIFTTITASTRSDLPAAVAGASAHEFAFEATLIFAEPSLNFDRKQYGELSAGLKELLERDTADTLRAVLRIASCDFTAHGRRGFCLGIRLVAEGDSPEQAQLRCGLAMARIQQALLFRARSLKQQIGA
jgi:hypothetical protein